MKFSIFGYRTSFDDITKPLPCISWWNEGLGWREIKNIEMFNIEIWLN